MVSGYVPGDGGSLDAGNRGATAQGSLGEKLALRGVVLLRRRFESHEQQMVRAKTQIDGVGLPYGSREDAAHDQQGHGKSPPAGLPENAAANHLGMPSKGALEDSFKDRDQIGPAGLERRHEAKQKDRGE